MFEGSPSSLASENEKRCPILTSQPNDPGDKPRDDTQRQRGGASVDHDVRGRRRGGGDTAPATPPAAPAPNNNTVSPFNLQPHFPLPQPTLPYFQPLQGGLLNMADLFAGLQMQPLMAPRITNTSCPTVTPLDPQCTKWRCHATGSTPVHEEALSHHWIHASARRGAVTPLDPRQCTKRRCHTTGSMPVHKEALSRHWIHASARRGAVTPLDPHQCTKRCCHTTGSTPVHEEVLSRHWIHASARSGAVTPRDQEHWECCLVPSKVQSSTPVNHLVVSPPPPPPKRRKKKSCLFSG